MVKPLERVALPSPVQEQWMSLRDDKLVGVREASRILGTSVYSLRRWIKLGRVRTCRVAGRLKIRQSEVLRLIQDERKNNAKEMPRL